MNVATDKLPRWGIIAACWGIAGVLALLARAIIALSHFALQALQNHLTPWQWIVMAAFVVFMAYSEGYLGFQKKFSPRVAARARYLLRSKNTLEIVLAPLFCMAFFNAPKKRIITSVTVLLAIITLIILFRLLPQPWRGILDTGVVVGLLWGCVSIVWCCYREFSEPGYGGDPELAVPAGAETSAR